MKTLSCTLLALLGILLCSVARVSAENIPNLYLHDSVSLNGDWKSIVDPYESGFFDYRWQQRDKQKWQSRSEAIYLDAKPANKSERIEYDFDASPSLRVPGDWNTQRPELFYYEGCVWYRRTFDYKATGKGERLFVRFGAVNYRADVYLNGRPLGTHIGGFTPFSFELTELVKEGSNSLVVRVDNKRAKSAVPTLNTDWWNYGGITREVRLVKVPARFIAEHRFHLESETTGRIAGWVQLSDKAAGESITVRIPELGLEAKQTTDGTGRASFDLTPRSLELWSPETPRLYTVQIASGSDSLSERIGFRTIGTRGRELLLNGKPVFLRGICIHEEFPLDGGGRVDNPEKARTLLTWAKELGCNFVRLAHYPHSEFTTRLADEMGLLVWSEVPVYWTIDWENEDTLANALSQITDNVRRDANRASIIIWSIANETPVNAARNRFLSSLAESVRKADSTRLLSAAMEKHADPADKLLQVVEDPLADLVDIVAFNQYVGWYDGLPEKCSRVSWKIPYNKPVFVSEFGGGARQGLHGDKDQVWTEEYQEELYRQSLPMLDRIDGLVGFSPWILVDFRSPKRLLPGVQDGFNRKGLISSEGKKKKAFQVLQEYYRNKR